MSKKKLFYLFKNPFFVIKTKLWTLFVHKMKLKKKHLYPTVSNNHKIEWLNDYKCRECNRFVCRRMLLNELSIGKSKCKGCENWNTKLNREVLRIGILNNYYRGIGDPDVEYELGQLIKEDSVFVDIGAHIGNFTALALSICGEKGKVYSFEPLSIFAENYSYIKKNLPPSVRSNFEFINSGISDKSGSSEMIMPNFIDNSSSWISKDDQDANNKKLTSSFNIGTRLGEVKRFKIEIKSFDQLCFDKVDVIKIDVEGHEPKVIKSILSFIEKSLSDNYPSIVFEHETKNYTKSELIDFEKTLEGLRSLGYIFYYAATKKIIDFPIYEIPFNRCNIKCIKVNY